jgi:hydrogenase maturation protease
MSRVLVAGIGNVFYGDDGFGVAVARRFADERLPPGIAVVDFGIRGLHLALELLEPKDVLVIADAVTRGGAPGTLYVIAPELDARWLGATHDPHGMNLGAVFTMVRDLGGRLPRLRIVGCEPRDLSMQMGLSAPVQRAIEPAVRLIRRLIESEVNSCNVSNEELTP